MGSAAGAGLFMPNVPFHALNQGGPMGKILAGHSYRMTALATAQTDFVPKGVHCKSDGADQ